MQHPGIASNDLSHETLPTMATTTTLTTSSFNAHTHTLKLTLTQLFWAIKLRVCACVCVFQHVVQCVQETVSRIRLSHMRLPCFASKCTRPRRVPKAEVMMAQCVSARASHLQ